MSTLELVIVCVTALLLPLSIATALSVRTDSGEEDALEGRTVTLHTKQPDDQTIHGSLVRETPDRLVLVDASYVSSTGEHPIPDRVIAMKSNVSWLQEHGAKEA
jgi:hypothetical protein